MRRLYIDLETYSDVPIKRGLHAYAVGVEILLFAYAFDDGPVHVWDRTRGGLMPQELYDGLRDPSVEVVAHNYQFERTVLDAHRMPARNVRWFCTMAQALAHGLPGGLEKLCAIFKIDEDQAKANDGRRLVQLFCMPRPKNMKLRRATRETHPEDWQKFIDYCGLDVEAMRAVAKKMPTWNL